MQRRARILWIVRVVASSLVAPIAAGCGGNLLPATLGAVAAQSVHSEPPVEIYSRVARGALLCWFGAQGSLKKTHVFHADVASADAGAEIVLHERDSVAANPRSIRAFRISIAPQGDGSTIQIENFRLAEPVAKDMREDIARWAGAKEGCSVIGTGGWAAKPGLEPAAEPKKKGAKK